MGRRILIAGIGNVFFGDDGFGVEVARRLCQMPLPANVRVTDFGIRGLDLAYALHDDCDEAILIDVVQRGGPPGTLCVLEPDVDAYADQTPMGNSHDVNLGEVFRLLRMLGNRRPVLRLVGCEPADFGGEGGSMTLSEAVQAAIEPAVELVGQLLRE